MKIYCCYHIVLLTVLSEIILILKEAIVNKHHKMIKNVVIPNTLFYIGLNVKRIFYERFSEYVEKCRSLSSFHIEFRF